MPTTSENAVQENRVFDEELSWTELENSLETELSSKLSDLSVLEEERKQIENPDSLIKIVKDEVWNQFANQIGLDMTNETLIQKYNREHPEDPEKYNKTIGDAIMQDPRYKEANAAMKRKHQDGTLVDAYTGKKMGVKDKPNLDHVVSRKEIHENMRRRQAGIATEDLANKPENLAPTNESINKSMGKKSISQYIEERAQREADLKKQAEAAHKKVDNSNKSEKEKQLEHEKINKRLQDKLDADDALMKAVDKKARNAINRKIAIGVAKQTTKKATKDALKMMVVTALFDLLKSIMNGLVRFFKEKQKTFQLFLEEMKKSIKRFVTHISSFVKTGTNTFVGTVVSEIFGPVVSTFKKLASFIKQGISSLVEVIHYLTAKENKNKPINVKIAQIGKIITAGLIAVGAIAISGSIETALLQIPVMHIEIPMLGTIANITGLFLASLLSGVVGAIIINRIDKYIAKQLKNDNLKNQIDKKNEILDTQGILTEVKVQRMVAEKEHSIQSIKERHEQAQTVMRDALTTIFHEDKNEDSPEIDGRLSSSGNKLDGLLS